MQPPRQGSVPRHSAPGILSCEESYSMDWPCTRSNSIYGDRDVYIEGFISSK